LLRTEPIKQWKQFRYENAAHWISGRLASISAPGKSDVHISSPPEFQGEPGRWTPEDLLVASVNACLLLSFAAYALREDLEIVSYERPAEGTFENTGSGYQFTEITLHPDIVVKSDEDAELARALLDSAHMGCMVTRSVKAAVKIDARFEVAG